jgi:hypothetical protein
VPKRRLVRLALIAAALFCGAVVVAASAVVLNGPAPLLVAGGAAIAAGAAACTTDKGRAAAVDAAWKAATVTVMAIVLVAGLAVLAGGTVATIAGLGCAVVAAVVLVLRAPPVRTAWSKRHGPQWLWVDRSPVPVSRLATSALAHEWRRTTVARADQPDPRTCQALVQRRQQVLDELERRDPIGFARWLAVAPPASDPAEFMEGRGATGTDAFGGQQ